MLQSLLRFCLLIPKSRRGDFFFQFMQLRTLSFRVKETSAVQRPDFSNLRAAFLILLKPEGRA